MISTETGTTSLNLKRNNGSYFANSPKDTTVMLFGYQMRLVVSPPPPKQINPKKKQNTQRWYILTNDMESTRDEILLIYATRFEIEETFKDYKHIQKLKTLRIKTITTFTILLWFASVAQWLAWWTKGGQAGKPEKHVHAKKKRSFFRIFWEELQRALRQDGLARIAILPASG
jgi:DDE family transposase